MFSNAFPNTIPIMYTNTHTHTQTLTHTYIVLEKSEAINVLLDLSISFTLSIFPSLPSSLYFSYLCKK